jgi:hypothetical protein
MPVAIVSIFPWRGLVCLHIILTSARTQQDWGATLKDVLIKLGVVLSIGALALSAACGGDDDEDAGDENTPAAEATAAATTAAEPTEGATEAEASSSDQPQLSEMTAGQQESVNTICAVAWDPASADSLPFDPIITLTSAQAGNYGMDIADAAGPLRDALQGTDDTALATAANNMLIVCTDIGWAPS